MKSLRLNAVITSIRAKVDKSIGLTIHTPELGNKEKALFFELQGINCEMIIKPLDVKADEIKIDKDLAQKSQSARIRNVLFVLYSQDKEGHEEFSTYYQHKTNKVIEHYKSLIQN